MSKPCVRVSVKGSKGERKRVCACDPSFPSCPSFLSSLCDQLSHCGCDCDDCVDDCGDVENCMKARDYEEKSRSFQSIILTASGIGVCVDFGTVIDGGVVICVSI